MMTFKAFSDSTIHACARQQFQVIDLVKKLEKSLEDIETPIIVSIIGCVVNGPGEANMTNIGITGGGNNTHMIYVSINLRHKYLYIYILCFL